MSSSVPTDEEMAAIVAAVAALFPTESHMGAPVTPEEPSEWRFSGRWWRKPVIARRRQGDDLRGW